MDNYAAALRRGLLDALNQRLTELENFALKVSRSLDNAPEGTARIVRKGGKCYYYHRCGPDTNGTIIRRDEFKLLSSLAQKRYDLSAIGAIRQEIDAIKTFLTQYPQVNAEEMIWKMPAELREHIQPLVETDEEFIAGWRKDYDNSFSSDANCDLITKRGEAVRSKSELIIANMLEEMGVPYQYEYPLYLEGLGIVHPDFRVLNVRTRKTVFWEHNGMMDSPGYYDNTVRKISAYIMNGYFPGDNLILSFETSTATLNTLVIRETIHRCLL